MTHKTEISKDQANYKIHVTREFDAPVEKVWKAWTESEILEKWWAPRPWKAITKIMDFKVGGMWLYYMAGPGGEKFYSRLNYMAINPIKNFSADNRFCDENGVATDELSVGHWHNTFHPTATGTRVEVVLSFDREASFKQLVEMGFEGGFTMALGNLDELL
jgi:uncharacterized protein YndB with AHSA1/START domain